MRDRDTTTIDGYPADYTEDEHATGVAETACTNPNHGYFVRVGVPCTCAVGTLDPTIKWSR